MLKTNTSAFRYSLRILAISLLTIGLFILRHFNAKPIPKAVENKPVISVSQMEKNSAAKRETSDTSSHYTKALAPRKENDGRRLMNAMYKDDIALMKRLLDEGANPNCPPAEDEIYVLVAAIKSSGGIQHKSTRRFVKILLDKGANPNVADSYDRSALWWAASCGDTKSMSLLLAHHARVDAPDFEGNTPLIEAAEEGQDAAIRFLLKHGANINMNVNHSCALGHAADHRHFSTVKLLVRHGANIYVNDNDVNSSVIWIAAASGKAEIVKYLIQNGANVNLKDEWGSSPLEIAENMRYDAIIALLKKAGAKEPVYNPSAH